MSLKDVSPVRKSTIAPSKSSRVQFAKFFLTRTMHSYRLLSQGRVKALGQIFDGMPDNEVGSATQAAILMTHKFTMGMVEKAVARDMFNKHPHEWELSERIFKDYMHAVINEPTGHYLRESQACWEHNGPSCSVCWPLAALILDKSMEQVADEWQDPGPDLGHHRH